MLTGDPAMWLPLLAYLGLIYLACHTVPRHLLGPAAIVLFLGYYLAVGSPGGWYAIVAALAVGASVVMSVLVLRAARRAAAVTRGGRA